MASDNATGMVYDAFACGNELRHVNAYNGVRVNANAYMGKACAVPNAPQWVTARPIKMAVKITEGEEIVLDYGEAYWIQLREARGDRLYSAVPVRGLPPGSLVEIDMDQVLELDNAADFNSSLFHGTLQSWDGDNAMVMLAGDEFRGVFSVAQEGVFAPRGPLQQCFKPGDEVEVLWKGEGRVIDSFFYGWWPATIDAIAPNQSYHVTYKARFNGYSSTQIVAESIVRAPTTNRVDSPISAPPKKKKRKKA